MLVRSFDVEQDYNDVCDWWKKQDWSALAPNLLGDNGFIIEDKSDKIAACWVFSTSCPIYIMEWTIGNPEVNWEKRQEAVELLIDNSVEWSKQQGAEYLLTMTSNKRFMEKLQDNKFTVTDNNVTHLMRRI